jgi:predicted permease
VGATSGIPFGGGDETSSFDVEGHQPAANQPRPWGDLRAVSPEYFQALKVPLRRGRVFTEQDGPDAPRVAIVDENLARRYWPHEDPIGKRVTFDASQGDSTVWLEVVGVVGHVKNDAVDSEARVQLYRPFRQATGRGMTVAIRTTGEPLAAVPLVRETIRAIDRDQPISGIASMDERVERGMGQRRVSTQLLAIFAGFALLIACMGLYGITAYAVSQRQREIGVRMALGAASAQVVGPFVRDSLTLVLIGLVIGSVAALGATRLLTSQLYEVTANDPSTLVGTAALLAVVAAVASYLPARRATSVDPVVALRSE